MIVILLLLCFLPSAWADTPQMVEVGAFSKSIDGELPEYLLEVRFQDVDRATEYALIEDEGIYVIKAVSTASASGIGREMDVLSQDYPVLKWRWKAENLVEGSDLTKKSGDDYALRIYVAFDHDNTAIGFFERILFRILEKIYKRRIPARALSYIWSKNAPVGTVVSNPYTNRVKMIVVQSGPEGLNAWHEFQRNIYEDYKSAFGKEPMPVKAIGMMTDTDNTGESVTAYYGDILLFKQAPGSAP